MIKYVLFDLDGTLVDSSPGVYSSLRIAFKKLNHQIPTDDQFKQFIGPPIPLSLKHVCNFSDSEIKQILPIYRTEYNQKGIHSFRLYEDVRNTLMNLKKGSVKIAVSTLKFEERAITLLKNAKIYDLFDCVCGALDENVKDKVEILERTMKLLDVKNVREVLMIGDSRYDFYASKQIGVKFCAVTYGFGYNYNQAFLDQCDFIKNRIDDIFEIIESNDE